MRGSFEITIPTTQTSPSILSLLYLLPLVITTGECMEEPIPISQEDVSKQTPPKRTLTQTPKKDHPPCDVGVIPLKWGRLLSMHPALPHFDLTTDTVTIGRKRENNLVLKEPTVSSRHCKITFDEAAGQALIEDMSSNGTFINGKRIAKGTAVAIKNHDRISLVVSGGLTYLFEDLISQIGKEVMDDDESGIDRDYAMYEKLGEGAFSTVRMAVHRKTGVKRAIKIIDLTRHPNQRAHQHIQREISILMSLDHPNIAKVVDVYLGKSCKVFLVMELAEGGELFDKISKEGACCEDEARFIFQQLLDALHFLHKRGITHRDLKPENILLKSAEPYPHVMITDFGLARILAGNELAQTQCGTPQYVAPEILLLTTPFAPNLAGGARGGYGKECDMWSLGGILYVLLSGVPPFREQDTVTGMNLMSRIEHGIFDFPFELWSGVSDEATDLVTKLLTVDRAARYTTEQALTHPWVVKGLPLPENTKPTPVSDSSFSKQVLSSTKSICTPPRTPLAPRAVNNNNSNPPTPNIHAQPQTQSSPSLLPQPKPRLDHKSKSMMMINKRSHFEEEPVNDENNSNNPAQAKRLRLL